MVDNKTFLGKVFHRETDREREDRLVNEALEEERKDVAEMSEREIPASVIRYFVGDEEDDNIHFEVLIEDFRCAVMPEIGSIIWCEVNHVLVPFKCIRYDFICNASEYDSMRTYIVVTNCSVTDIIPEPKYSSIVV